MQPYWISHLEFIKSDTNFIISELKNLGIPSRTTKYQVIKEILQVDVSLNILTWSVRSSWFATTVWPTFVSTFSVSAHAPASNSALSALGNERFHGHIHTNALKSYLVHSMYKWTFQVLAHRYKYTLTERCVEFCERWCSESIFGFF